MARYSRQQQQTGPTRAQILDSVTFKGWYDISTPYNKEFIDNLKLMVNPSMRRWNPTTKLWSVHSLALPDTVDLLKVYFDEVISAVGQSQTQQQSVSVDIFGQLFKTLKSLPNGNMTKVYSSLAVAVHPDHGGSNELMTQLNKAYNDNK